MELVKVVGHWKNKSGDRDQGSSQTACPPSAMSWLFAFLWVALTTNGTKMNTQGSQERPTLTSFIIVNAVLGSGDSDLIP